MSQMVITFAVDNAIAGQAIGIKEALAMDVEEKYDGIVRVLSVEVREPEQLSMGFPPDAKGVR